MGRAARGWGGAGEKDGKMRGRMPRCFVDEACVGELVGNLLS